MPSTAPSHATNGAQRRSRRRSSNGQTAIAFPSRAPTSRGAPRFRVVGRTRTLDSHASRLRRKLDPENGRYVVNCWAWAMRICLGRSSWGRNEDREEDGALLLSAERPRASPASPSSPSADDLDTLDAAVGTKGVLRHSLVQITAR